MVLAVPTPRTWNVSDIATSAMFNSNLRDGINYVTNPPLFVGYGAATTSIPNATWSGITIDTNEVDTYGGHSTSVNTSQYFAQVAGYYLITVRVSFAANVTGYRSIGVGLGSVTPVGSTEILLSPAPSGDLAILQTVTIQYLAVSASAVICAFQSSGGALNTAASTSEFSCTWLHA